MSSYISLFLASLFEVLWVFFLDKSAGFTRLSPVVVALSCMALSLFFLAQATKTLSMAFAYAMWVGLGILGTALVQHFIQDQQLKPFGWVCLLVITIGLIGLQMSQSSPTPLD
ncbi:multidrug efflux SMR transporter (plasmid) [Pseudoalteromonas xiamenensis]|uniref:DMT family transporter n=1 Tax=Pseudoalteromonas xiamenensis TaxID=882626 RepID=UPI0027E5A661|nr:multidrug efflux SMR transporter [Pseudoalteromonas xiamenensis]WMN61622.1 multidrug efflux SMR transporter [Pseudoalteromonas xiamenensis]